MAILEFTCDVAGQINVNPRRIKIITTDNLATVTAAGWLNRQGQVLQGFSFYNTDVIDMNYSYNVATHAGTYGVFLPSVASSGVITLSVWDSAGDVSFSGPASTVDALVVFSDVAGNIKAASTTTTLSQALVVAAPISSSTGNITSGSSGDAGTFVAFPATAANGTMIIAAGNAGGAFNTTITSGTIGQSTVYTVPDILASTGGVVVSTAAVRMKSVAAAAAAGGAAAQSFTDAFCTSGSNVIGNWNTQANAASVLKIVPGNGSFVVTSSADAGVGTFNYVIMK